METIILVIHLVVVIAMIGLILLQKTNSDGLSGLGGGGNNNALFSVRGKSNFLTKATGFLAVSFVITSLILAYLASNKSGYSLVDQIDPKTSLNEPSVKKMKADDVKTETAPEVPSEPAPQVPVAE